MISAIVAMDRNNLIGIDGKLPWHRPDDLKNFKALTTGHTVVMGRKTYESIGKPLSNRFNVVLSHQNLTDTHIHGNLIRLSKEEVISVFYGPYSNFFIIGGASIYREFAQYIERMYITVINEFSPVNGCEATYFPWQSFEPSSWTCVEQCPLGPDFYYVFDRIRKG
jgi:dihydrofolate reductase